MLNKAISLHSTYDLYQLPLSEIEQLIKQADKEAIEKAYLALLEEAKTTDRLYVNALRAMHKMVHKFNMQ